MAKRLIVMGLTLALATVLMLTVVTHQRHPAYILPMLAGIPIFVAGLVGLNPHRLRQWMRITRRIAVAGIALALLGAIATPLTSASNDTRLPMYFLLGLVLYLAFVALQMQRQLLASAADT